MIKNTQETIELSEQDEKLFNKLNTNHIDLVSERLGGEALSCSDDFFAGMENLVKPGRGIFIDDKYTDRGKWMDGWESRRSYGRTNSQGESHQFDWCILRLGAAGVIAGFEIDTNFFRGNAPQSISIDACQTSEEPDENTVWQSILKKNNVKAHQQNLFEVDNSGRWTHVRLNMFPDGGIARFRVYGNVVVNWDDFIEDELIDLAAIKNGAKALLVSDMFFSNKNNLIMPGRGKDMGDGWETKRRRDPGPDWSIVKLADKGSIEKVLIDTCHFKGNYPDTFMLEGIVSESDNFENNDQSSDWTPIIVQTKLHANREHLFTQEILANKTQTFTHVRLSIFPDGGISRMRVFGRRGNR